VTKIESKYRRIITELPVPDSVSILDRIEKYEPCSMLGQSPIVWDKAEGFQVFDSYGNIWLDWSSGVLVTNAGHGHPKIKEAVLDVVNHGLLFSYCFPTDIRSKLSQRIVELMPESLDKVFFLTTGSEAIENAIKLARTYGHTIGGSEKNVFVTFNQGFHGRTLGAQMAGGIPSGKTWIVNPDKDFIQVPFPDGFRNKNRKFECFTEYLEKLGLNSSRIAAVMMESYQGGGASFAPEEYVQELRNWCDRNEVLLIFDEIQSGFGRTGKLFAFEHYNVTPDMVCLGKGISGSLPLSAVVSHKDIADIYGPGSMTSTHGGNPVSCAAALANIDVLINDGLIENAKKIGYQLEDGLLKIAKSYPESIGTLHGKGLVYGLHIVNNHGEPDSETAQDIVRYCFENGLLMFSPVGFGEATIKICPPLMITSEAIDEGLSVLNSAFNNIN